MSNPADICREYEVLQKIQQLEEQNSALKKAGDNMAQLADKVFDLITYPSEMRDAVEAWRKVKEGAE